MLSYLEWKIKYTKYIVLKYSRLQHELCWNLVIKILIRKSFVIKCYMCFFIKGLNKKSSERAVKYHNLKTIVSENHV